MKAAIVTIGDEILIGQIIDTNSAWLAERMTESGIHVSEMSSISDDPEHIRSTLDRLLGKVDLILLTGGLGPTKDDLTKDTLADYFGGKLVMNQEILSKIEDFFRKRGRGMLESNQRQALLPDNCRILINNFGTAAGMWFEKEGSHIISMPGVPHEMKPMVTQQLLPALEGLNESPVIVKKTIMTHGVPESYLAEMIRDWENQLPSCMKLAYLPRPGVVRLRLSAKDACAADAEKNLKDQIELLKGRIGNHIFGYDDEFLESVLGKLFVVQNLSIATAESCTGGNIAARITSVPGSSSYFLGSVVAYSNEVKRDILKVPGELIREKGAVSREVAESMAAGIKKLTGSKIGISTTGIAGPDGGSDEKPVGIVWIAVADDKGVWSKRYRFGGHRELVIEQSTVMAMGMVYKRLNGLDTAP